MSVESYPDFYNKVQEEMGAEGKANPVTLAGFSTLHTAAGTDGPWI
jgi:hypothetical protein